MNSLLQLKESARNKDELGVFNKLIKIILCLEKHKHLNMEVDYNDKNKN